MEIQTAEKGKVPGPKPHRKDPGQLKKPHFQEKNHQKTVEKREKKGSVKAPWDLSGGGCWPEMGGDVRSNYRGESDRTRTPASEKFGRKNFEGKIGRETERAGGRGTEGRGNQFLGKNITGHVENGCPWSPQKTGGLPWVAGAKQNF